MIGIARILLTTMALTAGTGLALAQTATPMPGMASPQGQPAMTPAQQPMKDRVMGERQSCRQQALAQGVQGEQAIRQAVMACVARLDPQMGRRMACQQEGRAKGLSGPEAMRPYVQACMARAG